jgi:hypothetical protein
MAAFLQGPANTLAPDFEEDVFPTHRTEILAGISTPTKISPSFAALGDCWHLNRRIAAICNQHYENMAIYI